MEEVVHTESHKSHAGWTLVIIIVTVIFVVYWLFIRPGQIKNECYNYAYSTPNNGNTNEWVQATKYYYEACLHNKGL